MGDFIGTTNKITDIACGKAQAMSVYKDPLCPSDVQEQRLDLPSITRKKSVSFIFLMPILRYGVSAAAVNHELFVVIPDHGQNQLPSTGSQPVHSPTRLDIPLLLLIGSGIFSRS